MERSTTPVKEQFPKLDKTDLAILRLLQQNSRITIREIAESVSLSTTPVHDRIRRLETTGVISQYITLLNPAAVGKGLMVICYVSLTQHNKRRGNHFITSIMEMPEVLECLTISGEFDFMLKIVAADMDEYYHFHVNKLSAIENVGNVQSVFVMGIVKQTHQLV